VPRLPSLGALVTTEVESQELGTFGDRRLTGLTQRRAIRLALGERTALRWSLTRLRPVAVEVEERDRRYRVPVKPAVDAMLWSATRIAALWAGAIVTRIFVAAAASRLAANRKGAAR
jgi:hypothetical protein